MATRDPQAHANESAAALPHHVAVRLTGEAGSELLEVSNLESIHSATVECRWVEIQSAEILMPAIGSELT